MLGWEVGFWLGWVGLLVGCWLGWVLMSWVLLPECFFSGLGYDSMFSVPMETFLLYTKFPSQFNLGAVQVCIELDGSVMFIL